jgi:predicted N-acyltransferase
VTPEGLTARVHRRISEIGQKAWDACNPAGSDYNPFTSFVFLHCLEESGCVGDRTGWSPHHIALTDRNSQVLGVMPVYLKSHSQGEYVFDHSWAEAYERAGGRYYPKLQCASPFSPVTGPRLLVNPKLDRGQGREFLLQAGLGLCEQLSASGLHVTFPDRDDWDAMGKAGMLQRKDQQYHWVNQGYESFDQFLGALSANRRKTIRRERRDAQSGIEIHALSGGDLNEDHWDAIFQFYMDTGSRKWGRPYLNRLFFSLLGERMPEDVLLIMARREGRWIAGALNLIGGDCLYGRNWGCIEDRPFLHFELCYYQAIEQAIRLGLNRVEAGAQGQHKIARGYLPTPVYSAHWIADPALREPVRQYLDREREAVQGEIDWLTENHSPFRQ